MKNKPYIIQPRFTVSETSCFCGGFEVTDNVLEESVSEIYTYAAEAQERADELNEDLEIK